MIPGQRPPASAAERTQRADIIALFTLRYRDASRSNRVKQWHHKRTTQTESAMKFTRKRALFVLLLVAGLGILTAFELRGKGPVQYYTAKVEGGEIKQVVEATGTINAVITVQVGSQVSGTISKLYVDFNSHVKKGQLIAQIDPPLFEGALSQARADLENARANLAVAVANTAKARAAAVQTKAD